MKRIQLSAFGILIVTTSLQAQEFTIRKVEFTPETIVLHYDLLDTAKGHTYTISVYSSTNNFNTALQKVKGDVGMEVRPGYNKKIAWSSKEELGSTFKGDVELEIRGRVYVPFIKFDGFQEEQVIKRGKVRTITWSGGTTRNLLNFNLYRKGKEEDEYIDVIPNIPNTGSYDMIIPKSVKPGKGYYFLINDSKNKDQAIRTQPFQVKRKVPLSLTLAPVIAVGAAGYLFLKPSSKTVELEGPPDVPGSSNE